LAEATVMHLAVPIAKKKKKIYANRAIHNTANDVVK
jgi:hypothetical protein